MYIRRHFGQHIERGIPRCIAARLLSHYTTPVPRTQEPLEGNRTVGTSGESERHFDNPPPTVQCGSDPERPRSSFRDMANGLDGNLEHFSYTAGCWLISAYNCGLRAPSTHRTRHSDCASCQIVPAHDLRLPAISPNSRRRRIKSHSSGR